MRKFGLGLAAVVLGLCGCMTPVVLPEVPHIVGHVEFPAPIGYKIQTTVGYVAKASTVELIDPINKETVGTTITSADGAFDLGFGRSFAPVPDRTYYLEAVKGLADHAAGHNAVRVRSLITYRQGWHSIALGDMTINRSTTAISVTASLKELVNAELGGLIDSLTLKTPDSSSQPTTPDTFAGSPKVTVANFHTAFGMVDTALRLDNDPFATIVINGDGGLILTAAPKLNVAPTNGASVGDTITLTGGIFDPQVPNNSVLMNGVPATVSGATDAELKVLVPAGATSGPISVVASGLQYQVPYFVVYPTLAFTLK